jgi:hypothetical protein
MTQNTFERWVGTECTFECEVIRRSPRKTKDEGKSAPKKDEEVEKRQRFNNPKIKLKQDKKKEKRS